MKFGEYWGLRPDGWFFGMFFLLIDAMAHHSSPALCALWATLFAMRFWGARMDFLTVELRRKTWALAQGTPFAESMARSAMDEALR